MNDDTSTVVPMPEITEILEDQEIPLPGGFYQRRQCFSCRQINSVNEVIIEEDAIRLNYLCDCGYDYAILHTGGKVAAYHAFIENLNKEQEDIVC